jgi:hypothetical protein
MTFPRVHAVEMRWGAGATSQHQVLKVRTNPALQGLNLCLHLLPATEQELLEILVPLPNKRSLAHPQLRRRLPVSSQ